MEHVEPEPAVWGRPRPGVDGAREVRPGVPREHQVRADTGADGSPLQPGVEEQGRGGRGRTRARVFGTGQPARGASGALRGLAYRVPEHRAAHWGLLLVADRVDVLDHRLRRGGLLLAVLGAAWVGFSLARRGFRRARR
jgi:hypothetical protein